MGFDDIHLQIVQESNFDDSFFCQQYFLSDVFVEYESGHGLGICNQRSYRQQCSDSNENLFVHFCITSGTIATVARSAKGVDSCDWIYLQFSSGELLDNFVDRLPVG